MNWRIIAIGKPKLAFAQAGIDEYVSRIKHFVRIEVVYLKAGKNESEQLYQASRGTCRVLLDERGKNYSSLEFANLVRTWSETASKTCSLIVGGADGHSESLRQEADLLWSLGRATLQHELALTVALEQLYRGYTINHRLPYHRQHPVARAQGLKGSRAQFI
jgi:23S rRNA (pseudouridine1915-N3)-methyltransferase